MDDDDDLENEYAQCLWKVKRKSIRST